MTVRILIKKILSIASIFLVGFAIYYASQALPILSGYGAKNLCSCVMLGNRTPDHVLANELGGFPLNLGDFRVNWQDSSVSGSVFGLAKKKAIYRKGLGCTLISQIDEATLRNQKINLATGPVLNQDTINWPMGNRMVTNLEAVIDEHALKQLVDQAFEEPGEKPSRKTRAILIVYNGVLIAEKYGQGFDEKSLQTGWSMTKSLTNAMVGNLVLRGKLKVQNRASIYEWRDDERKNIRLDDLMRMSSGLSWKENYGGPSSATNMLFKSAHMSVFAAQSKLRYKPGEYFYYSSGTTNIISRIVRQIYFDNDYYRLPYEDVFYKIGMHSLVMEPDAGGTFVGSSYAYATARDWARFGLLYLNDGLWNGERILPEGWVDYTTTPAKGAKKGQYGAQFWLNAGAPDDPANRMYPDVPTDLFWADGFEGQNVFILPSKQLVVVKLGQTTGNALDDNAFLKALIALLPR